MKSDPDSNRLEVLAAGRRSMLQIRGLSLTPFLDGVFFMFNLDIGCEKKRKPQVGFRRLCQGGFVLWFLLIVATHMSVLASYWDTMGTENHKQQLKGFVSTIISNGLVLLLWFSMWSRRKRLSKAIQAIAASGRKFESYPTYGFPNACVVFTFLMYVSSVVLSVYPFDQETYDSILERHRMLSVFRHNQTLDVAATYVYAISYEAVSALFPASVVSLYVIQCHNLKTALALHVRRCSEVRHEVGCLVDYDRLLQAVEAFEGVASTPICVSFSLAAFNLFFMIMLHSTQGINAYNDQVLLANFVLITVVTFSAARVCERDGDAKKSNLEYLEDTLRAGKRTGQEEVFRHWRISNRPAFELSGADFFTFTREFYLSAMGALVTYTLLFLNI